MYVQVLDSGWTKTQTQVTLYCICPQCIMPTMKCMSLCFGDKKESSSFEMASGLFSKCIQFFLGVKKGTS